MNQTTTVEASDYRSSQNDNSTVKELKSYSSVLSQPQYPTKQQAIVFSTVDGIKLQEYIIALGTIISPKNILFSSRISNNRVCIYLSSKEIVDKFMTEHGSIKINNEVIHARRLITPSERLLMSNVCPTIPHNVLLYELQKLGLNLISPITFLKINIPNPEYSHILSFRRQVYISPSTNTMPDSILVGHDNTQYRIFLSVDGLSCFKCKQPGHIASQCTQNNENTEESHIENPSECQQTSSTLNNESITLLKETGNHNNKENVKEKTTLQESAASTSHKRSICEVISPTPETEVSIDDTQQPQPDFRKPDATLKKYKYSNTQENTKPIEDLMKPTKSFIESYAPPFVLNYEQFLSFFENIHGSPDPLSIAKQHTENIHALLEMMTKVYPHFEDRSIKARCTKARKKIMKQLQESLEILGVSDNESESSSHETW